MTLLENKIPPLLVAVICAVIMWLLAERLVPTEDIGWAKAKAMAIFITVILAAYFCLAGVMAFRAAKTTANPLKPETAASLVQVGVYRISRNPMYLGFALFLTAWAIYLESFWSLFGLGGFILFITRFQILPEERAMQALFGDEFKDYAKAVRRWL